MNLLLDLLALLLVYALYTALINYSPQLCPYCTSRQWLKHSTGNDYISANSAEGEPIEIVTVCKCRRCDKLYAHVWHDHNGQRAIEIEQAPKPTDDIR